MRSALTATIALCANTLFETVRQSVFGVILAAGAALIVFSPAFAMFTFMDSTKLVQDMGLATILLTGLFLGVHGAATVLSREIQGRTALTVLAKPVSREAFILGKFTGLALALTVATYILSIVLILTFRFGVKDTASTKLDWAVLGGFTVALAVAMLIGAGANYFFNRPFISTTVWSLICTLTLCLVFFAFYDKDGDFSTFGTDINFQIALAAFLALDAVLILAAVAVTVSTRGGVVAGLTACFLVFIAGLLSEFLFSSHLDTSAAARLAYALLPNFQVFWITEAILTMKIGSETTRASIPWSYVAAATAYAAFYIGACLCLAIALFHRREVSR